MYGDNKRRTTVYLQGMCLLLALSAGAHHMRPSPQLLLLLPAAASSRARFAAENYFAVIVPGPHDLVLLDPC